MKKFLLSLIVFLTASGAYSQSAPGVKYVSDSLWIYMRSGPSNEYRIVKSLRSGTKVSMISENVETGFLEIKTDKDLVGWVPKSQLIDTPVARDRLKGALEKIESLEKALADRDKMLSTEQTSTQSLLDQTQDLSHQVAKLEQQNMTLTQQNNLLSAKGNKDLIIFGAAIAMISALLGAFVIPRLKPGRNSQW